MLKLGMILREVLSEWVRERWEAGGYAGYGLSIIAANKLITTDDDWDIFISVECKIFFSFDAVHMHILDESSNATRRALSSIAIQYNDPQLLDEIEDQVSHAAARGELLIEEARTSSRPAPASV